LGIEEGEDESDDEEEEEDGAVLGRGGGHMDADMVSFVCWY